MLPVTGLAHVGYVPRNRLVGFSKLARVVLGFARRVQIQEKLTAEIAEAIQDILQPQGVGVVRFFLQSHCCTVSSTFAGDMLAMASRQISQGRRQRTIQPFAVSAGGACKAFVAWRIRLGP